MNKSNITWTETTWSPVIGCTKVSAGCKHCYAEREVNIRWGKNPKSIWYGRNFTDVLCRPEVLAGASSPLKWKKPRRIFVCPRADLFHQDVPAQFRADVFGIMAATPRHTYQVLTKRPEAMRLTLRYRPFREAVEECMAMYTDAPLVWPLPNVQLGTSIEDQATADERVPLLLATPAAVRWVSAEPLLGSIYLRDYIDHFAASAHGTHLDWVVAGGESGPNARPIHPDWIRSLRNQCDASAVPFLFKQWGEWYPADLLPEETALRASQWAVVDTISGEFRTGVEGQAKVDPDRHQLMGRIGVRKAGRLLDGVLHDGYPAVLS